MPATERELAEDAPWKQIQKNTFTRWCNEHLKIINKRLGSLETDLSDGLRLIGLIEILSQKKMGKHNKRPNFRQMKLENVSVALKFLETERIKLVSIGECNCSSILSQYAPYRDRGWESKTHPRIDMDPHPALLHLDADVGRRRRAGKRAKRHQSRGCLDGFRTRSRRCPSPTSRATGRTVQRLAHWLITAHRGCSNRHRCRQNSKARQGNLCHHNSFHITSFKSLSISATPYFLFILFYFLDFLCFHLSRLMSAMGRMGPSDDVSGRPSWDCSGRSQNNQTECILKACVITPEEITNPNVDELSVMTYLSQFPKSTLKPGAPLRPKTNSKKARAYGKGVEPKGCKVGAPAPFTVETIAAGNGDVLVYLTNPEGHKEELKATPNNDKLKTFNVTYYPDMPGEYEVTILFAGAAIHKSPFKVQVDDSPADPSKVTAKGPGLMPGNIVNHPTHFDVFTADAGKGGVTVAVVGPDGQQTADVPMELEEKSNGTVRATYTPQVDGPHKIYVEFTGEQVPRSPFNVDISPGMLCLCDDFLRHI
uniref:Calponin-homology (CH) domain-containing protein n=1 Tax=Ciona savignyi TaxID=51511 RepID=H2ZJT7_CIOSA